ncbi:MAG: DUF202 domain-containing protein, partial [Pseudomonadales bacterium]|nr:DUF202 domain-containing protein [Pseudomonadales bacterium]
MSGLNDPRVLFAAERTLFAWNRTGVSLMAFGFVIERFGLFLQISGEQEIKVFQRHISFIIGESFVLLAVFMAFFSIWQYSRVIESLRSDEVPDGYRPYAGVVINGIVGMLGLALSLYLARGF